MLFNCFQNRFSEVLPVLYFNELAARGSFDLTLLTYSTHSPGASTKWFPKVSGAKCVSKSNAMAATSATTWRICRSADGCAIVAEVRETCKGAQCDVNFAADEGC